ncbi:MAG: 1-acyl-sn-glycerol-3-phosphate acyltransferase, partial [Oscillospiraceae bacterium]
QMAGVDILPVRIIFKGGKMKIFGKVTVVFGEPITTALLGLEEKEHTASALRGAKAIVTEKLENMLEENREYL